ncbi:MAG: asparagine synthase (glutamine-hydrolyzing) [Candidatus Angelobacter sp.]|nr:asparagine synthase (glutamine-hydrolyzing) [Candidatus Angelobacter sp.]
MCGIAGFVSGTRQINHQWVPAVLERLRHRGPDDKGWLKYSPGMLRTGRQWNTEEETNCDVLLLHRRLSIIDLSAAGWQPMSSDDGRYHLVYNGEIYNYLELRTELKHLGYSFHTQTDSEVLLTAYAEWGARSLLRFVGMFAFAILDIKRRTVFLARDFFGIKPLYYAACDEYFAFASEITALLELTRESRQVNPSALLLYLRHGLSDQGTTTLLAGINQLPAAHYMEVSLGTPRLAQPVRYWIPQVGKSELSFDEAAQRLQELFLDSVRLHLRSDVPVGAALSGGIDSSAIVAAMRRVDPSLEIHTFSYIAEDPSLSEERWVDLMAGSIGAKVHKLYPTSDDLVHDIEALIDTQEEPFVSTSVYAGHRVFRQAGQDGIKVMLDGQGADELLGGYRYYLGAQFASLLRKGRYWDAMGLLRSASALPDSGILWMLFCGADYMIPKKWQGPVRALLAKEFTPRWVNAAWFSQYDAEIGHTNYCPEPDVLRATLLRTINDTSLPHLLRYEDRNSMAFSIESRVPFLTAQLAEFVLSLPEHYIIALDGTSKAVFRSAMRGIVPDAILNRRDKVGFSTPEQKWLSLMNTWVQATLHSEVAAGMPFLNCAAMDSEWNAVILGRQKFDNRIWRWLNVIRWSQQFSIEYSR